MMFSAQTLAFRHACPLHQHHTSFLAIDPRTSVMFSSEFMNVTHLNRYSFPSCEELAPLALLRDGAPTTLQGVQGAAVDRSVPSRLFLSTNQVPLPPLRVWG